MKIEINERDRLLASAAKLKISYMFGNSPEERLCLNVIHMAIMDAVNQYHQEDAIKFLSGNILYAELCGVDSEAIHEVLYRIGIL